MKAALQLSNELSLWDWLVFSLILIMTFGAVVVGNLRRKQVEPGAEASMLDLLLMGRRLTLPLFTATLVATWYGGIFGVSEWAFTMGIYNWLTQGIFWYAAYLLFAFALVHKVRGSRARTMPDLLGHMFGPDSAKLGAWFNLLNLLPLTYIIGVGLLFQAVFGGSSSLWMLLGTVVVLLYSTRGGLRSVVYSDLVQFSVMCSAVLLVIVYSMKEYGGLGWLRSVPHIPESHWSLDGGMPLAGTLIWGFIALGTLVDPNFYQRCLAAKDARTARNGILLATCVWVVFDFCTTFGALYALAVIPEAEAKMAYLFYSVQLLPDGLKGFFLAGFLATILSTLDSYLFLAGTAVAYDLAPARRKGSVGWHHAGTVFVAFIALSLAVIYQRQTALVNIWKTIGGYTTACLLLPLTLGYVRPLRDRSFVRSALGGAFCMTLWMFLLQEGGVRLDAGRRALNRLPGVELSLDTVLLIEPFYAGLAGSLLGILLSAQRRTA